MKKSILKFSAITLSVILSISTLGLSAFAASSNNNLDETSNLKLYQGHSTTAEDQLSDTNSAVTLTQDGTYTITGNGRENNNIVIGTNENPITVTLYLDNVNVSELSNSLSCIDIAPFSTANIVICGNVSLTGGLGGCGIAVPENATVSISGETSSDTLSVTGTGKWACGIGWFDKGATASGDIKVENLASLYAKGGYYGIDMTSENGSEGGPAIGGGRKENQAGGNIVLNNIDKIEAYGGSKSAGIGASFWESCDITISNCDDVTSFGGATGAGIGMARLGNTGEGGYILDGSVTIQNCKSVTAYGGYEAAGIGNGSDYKNLLKNGAKAEDFGEVNVLIDNSTVNAFGGNSGAGIGGGYKSWNVNVNIQNGSDVYAVGGKHESKNTLDQNSAAGIGSGADGSIVGYTNDVKSLRTISIDKSSKVRAASNGGKWAIDLGYTISGDAIIAQGRFINSPFLTNSYKDGSQYEASSLLATSEDGELLNDNTNIIQVGDQKVALPSGYICVAATQTNNGTITVTSSGYQTDAASYLPNGEDAFSPNKDGVSADYVLSNGLNSFDYMAFRPEVKPTPVTEPDNDSDDLEDDDITDIEDTDPPLSSPPVINGTDNNTEEIIDNDIPMSSAPQDTTSNPKTGNNDMSVFIIICGLALLFSIFFLTSYKSKKKKDI